MTLNIPHFFLSESPVVGGDFGKDFTLEASQPDNNHYQGDLTAFMHRSLIMGACRRVVGFFEKPAQGDPPRRFSVAEMV